eukprot:4565385-Ditylum_brightwellii.AAC.1
MASHVKEPYLERLTLTLAQHRKTEFWEPTEFKQEFEIEHKDKVGDTPDGKWLKQVNLLGYKNKLDNRRQFEI